MKRQTQFLKATTAVTLLLPAAGLLSALGGCNTSEVNSNPVEAVAVRTARVEKATIAPPIRATGLLFGKAESKLSFKTGGIIDRIVVSEGQSVQRGQLLATLKLSEINAQVHQSQNAFDKAERDLRRVQNLYRDSVATLEEFQDATTGFEVAKSALEITTFNWRHASICAPAAGKILKRFVEANELVSPGAPVLMMRNAQEGWVVKVGLADRDVVRVAIGDAARLAFDAYPEQIFSAIVSEISGTATPMTGTYEVELKVDPAPQETTAIHQRERGSIEFAEVILERSIELPAESAEGALFLSGMIAKVEILPAKKSLVSLVPIESLIEADGLRGNLYTIASPNVAKKIGVAVAFIHDQHAAITAGLDGIDEVITDGAAYLSDGDAIKVVP